MQLQQNYHKFVKNEKKKTPKNYKFITSKRKIQKGIVVIHELHNTAEIQQLSNNKKKKDTYSYRKRRGEVIANWGLHLRFVICMKAKNVYRFRVCRCGVVFETRELCKSVCVTHWLITLAICQVLSF